MELIYIGGISLFIALSFGIVGQSIRLSSPNKKVQSYGHSSTYKYLQDMRKRNYEQIVEEKYWEESKLNII